MAQETHTHILHTHSKTEKKVLLHLHNRGRLKERVVVIEMSVQINKKAIILILTIKNR